uniref:NR LBD domain-containing protein n=1 Tax=Romanomermis culicivorax TaxID=13658 RepID=A0A915HXP3_ROMCU
MKNVSETQRLEFELKPEFDVRYNNGAVNGSSTSTPYNGIASSHHHQQFGLNGDLRLKSDQVDDLVSVFQNRDRLINAVHQAHIHTALYSEEERRLAQLKPVDEAFIMQKLKNMMIPRPQLWADFAENLTKMIQQIIEFAKLVPGFLGLVQEDQIMLLKAGAFQISILRMTQLYVMRTDHILYGGVYLPISFFSSEDTIENQFMMDIFALVRQLCAYGLTEQELALFTAALESAKNIVDLARIKQHVYLYGRNDELINRLEIAEMHKTYFDHLINELRLTHRNQIQELNDALRQIMSILHNLAAKHTNLLAKFKKSSSSFTVDWPPLYKELFAVDDQSLLMLTN